MRLGGDSPSRSRSAAGAADAAQGDVVPGHLEVDPLGDPVDGLFERVVVEGLHRTAARETR